MVALKILHLLFLCLAAVVGSVVGSTLALLTCLFLKKRHRPFQLAARFWSRMLVFLSGVRITLIGRENLPRNQPVLLAVNHQSIADIPILLGFIPVFFRFAIKKELFAIPVFGQYLQLAGYFSIDREMILSGYKVFKTMQRILEEGDSILIFPEGTRSRDGTLGSFKRGSLLAALKCGVPIVPVALSGSHNIVPRGTRLINPSTVRVTIGKPVYIKTNEEYDQKINEVRAFIAGNL